MNQEEANIEVESGGVYECLFCDQSFANRKDLRNHKRTVGHTNKMEDVIGKKKSIPLKRKHTDSDASDYSSVVDPKSPEITPPPKSPESLPLKRSTAIKVEQDLENTQTAMTNNDSSHPNYQISQDGNVGTSGGAKAQHSILEPPKKAKKMQIKVTVPMETGAKRKITMLPLPIGPAPQVTTCRHPPPHPIAAAPAFDVVVPMMTLFPTHALIVHTCPTCFEVIRRVPRFPNNTHRNSMILHVYANCVSCAAKCHCK